jgi:uncharacterized protein
VNSRPWQSDAEIEAGMRQNQNPTGGAYNVPFYMRRPPKPPRPDVTYGLLISFIVVYVMELFVQAAYGDRVFTNVFTIYSTSSYFEWIQRPWSPLTSMLSHGGLSHLFFNGLALYFFGPTIENVIGKKRFAILFFASGIVSSIIQSGLDPSPALGASGAIMAVLGISVIFMPKSKIIVFPLPIPIPLWIAGVGFALLDLAGVFTGGTNIGHFAHLAGLLIGLVYGYLFLQKLKERGMRLVSG